LQIELERSPRAGGFIPPVFRPRLARAGAFCRRCGCKEGHQESVVMRRLARNLVCTVVVALSGCGENRLTPASWNDSWRARPFDDSGWKRQSGAWGYSSTARDIERNLGFE
jgi:hypothetical protein